MQNKQHIDKTSAEDKSIGFDFQYYYFLNELLKLKKGETLGLEVMDDVHTELSDNTQIFVQLKYTVQTQKDGSPINLTTLDSDFWKTLSNWCKVVVDGEAGRSEEQPQLEFVGRTVFLLASNKSENEKNKTVNAILSYQGKQISHSALIEKIKEIQGAATDKKIVGYIADALGLSENVSIALFKKLRFDLGCDDIIKLCKESISEKLIDPTRVDDVFRSLDSQIRSDNFSLVSNRQKIQISYDDFVKKYRVHFDKARNRSLTVHRHFDMPKIIGEQLFIRQLIDIGDVTEDDLERITRLLYHQLLAKNSLDGWLHEGEITSLDVLDLEEDAITSWENRHRKAYRNVQPEDNLNELAQNVVDELRAEKLSISQQQMERPFSNGEYYDLCEQKRIGWRNDWKEKYK